MKGITARENLGKEDTEIMKVSMFRESLLGIAVRQEQLVYCDKSEG